MPLNRPLAGRLAGLWLQLFPFNGKAGQVFGGGRFTTPHMSDHLHSNMQVIQRFLPVVIESRVREEGGLIIECRAR